jgi:hypothetical protein
METSNNSSGKKPSLPETDNSIQRTVDEVLAEIREIIDNSHWVQTRLAKLETSGFEVEDCWVKNGNIETMWFMKQKKVLRIQVAESEPRGDHHRAKCVIIPAADIKFQEGDEARVRHLPNIK